MHLRKLVYEKMLKKTMLSMKSVLYLRKTN